MADESDFLENDRTAPEQEMFHRVYEDGVEAPWDIGRPQSDILALVERGAFRGEVLDVGCGPGDHAVLLATRGLSVTAVDMVPNAIAKARARAARLGASVTFVVGSALELESLGKMFDTVLDSGLFHVFDDAMRATYVASLARVVRPGGTVYVHVFSERELGEGGPRRIREADLREAFADGWTVREIRPSRWEHNVGEKGYAEAWLASIERERA